MRDLSFVIPIRVDTPDRLENCEAILRFLQTHFHKSEIQLVEQDVSTQTAALRAAFPQVVWHFEFNDAHFSRSRAINTGLLRSTRRIVCAYDTDILIDPEALRKSALMIGKGCWPIIIPFNLIFLELSGSRRKQLIDNLDLRGLTTINNLSKVPHHPEIASRVLSGAIMMCDRELIIMEGGYNRKMISYGWEDIEFFKRFEKLGYYSCMLHEFNLIHLDHRRGPDSRVNEMYKINQAEFDQVLAMSESELKCYVEKELLIAPPIDPHLRGRVRRRHAMGNLLTFRWAAHKTNKAATLWRINGTRAVMRKLLGYAAPA